MIKVTTARTTAKGRGSLSIMKDMGKYPDPPSRGWASVSLRSLAG